MVKYVVALLGVMMPTMFGSLYVLHLRNQRRERALARRKKGVGTVR